MPKNKREGKKARHSLPSAYVQQPRSMYTFDEYEAIRTYTDDSWINGDLAEYGYDGLDEDNQELVDYLDSAIKKSEFNEMNMKGAPQLYRGVGEYALGVTDDEGYLLESLNNAEAVKFINKNLIGNTFLNKGYTSVTSLPYKASVFGRYILRFKNGFREGIHAMAVSGQGSYESAFSSYGSSEQEIIAERDVEYTIIGAKMGKIKTNYGDSKSVIYVDVIAY